MERIEMSNLRFEPKGVAIGVLFFLVLFIPTFIVGIYFYQDININLTNQVYTQRATIAALSASAIRLKLDQLSSLTEQLAHGPGDHCGCERR